MTCHDISVSSLGYDMNTNRHDEQTDNFLSVTWCVVIYCAYCYCCCCCVCSISVSSPTFQLNSRHSWLARWRPFGTGVVAHVGGMCMCVCAVCVSLIVCLSVIVCLTGFLQTLSSFYYFSVIDSSLLYAFVTKLLQ